MPNHGSKYDEKQPKKAYVQEEVVGIQASFNKGWKRFWEKRGIDISKENFDLHHQQNLSEPIDRDTYRESKAIEYGRSYRKDKND